MYPLSSNLFAIVRSTDLKVILFDFLKENCFVTEKAICSFPIINMFYHAPSSQIIVVFNDSRAVATFDRNLNFQKYIYQFESKPKNSHFHVDLVSDDVLTLHFKNKLTVFKLDQKCENLTILETIPVCLVIYSKNCWYSPKGFYFTHLNNQLYLFSKDQQGKYKRANIVFRSPSKHTELKIEIFEKLDLIKIGIPETKYLSYNIDNVTKEIEFKKIDFYQNHFWEGCHVMVDKGMRIGFTSADSNQVSYSC